MRGEYYDDNDRMFNPDCFDPDKKLFDSEGEDDTENCDYDAVVNFWATNQKASIIRQLVANSVKSLERVAPSSELKNADDKEWEKYIIRIVTDKNKNTLSIIDNGVGMTEEELKSYGSSSGRDLLSVADKVVVRTKQEEGNDEEYVMELSPEEKNIVVTTQKEDEDLCHLWSRGTKITLFLNQQDEAAEYLGR